MVEIVHETHFAVHMENGRDLSFSGSEAANYAEVSFGGDEMKMMVRITGRKNALIKPRFIVFRTKLAVISLGEYHMRSRAYHIGLNENGGCIRGYLKNGSWRHLP